MTNIQSGTTLGPVFIGLPMWQHSSWPKQWFGKASRVQLADYSAQLNSIEGNTTFYHLPSQQVVDNWAAATPDDFRFTFKFHSDISHKYNLQHCDEMVTEQLTLLSRLEEKLGLILLQLPASFGPRNLSTLNDFLRRLPDTFRYAVEVRHPALFAKGDAEKALNRILMENRANRIIMDTRALFTGDVDSEMTAEVRTKKPRVPVNVIATSEHPVMRFVGNNNQADNEKCLQPWVGKCHEWRLQGKTCYLFFHRPDNKDAPWLAEQFIQLYNQRYPEANLPGLTFPPAVEEQHRLF